MIQPLSAIAEVLTQNRKVVDWNEHRLEGVDSHIHLVELNVLIALNSIIVYSSADGCQVVLHSDVVLGRHCCSEVGINGRRKYD